MKHILILLFFILTAHTSGKKWGQTGHRTVGEVAEQHLTPTAKKAVERILEGESMAIASTWMDEIRSDPHYDYTHDWHWVTIPDRQAYGDTEKNPNGDIIHTIQTIITDLRQSDLEPEEEAEKLKMLIHLMGDIHQPAHVGTGEDRGGNDTRVEWFWEPSNLHRVWDSGMIDQYQLSYTELAESINRPTPKQVREWQSSGIMDWAYESMELREQMYDLPEDGRISYEYMYHNFETVERRLLQAGVRLAGILNDIYG